MTRKYPQADIKILYSKAAGRCAFKKCRENVVLEKTEKEKSKQIGKIAHIVAHSPNGPRADSSYPKDKLDSYDNWILLCPTCHDTVDAQESKYTVTDLHLIKKEHEDWVAQQLDENMSEVGFPELEVAAKAIASGQYVSVAGFEVIPPDEKIRKNKLTNESRSLLLTGLSRSHEVTKYLSKSAQLDYSFPERLKEGFKDKYIELKEEFDGDALFMAMFEFAKAGASDFKQQAASLALLSHLFELCEVFEK